MDAQIMPGTPLWGAEDQCARLNELTAGTDDRAKELPLRRDVRSLGILLGRVLTAQAGEPLFKTAGQPRRLLIQSRAHSAPPAPPTAERGKARKIGCRLCVPEGAPKNKAFALYFQFE